MVNETMQFFGLSGMTDPLVRAMTLVVEWTATYLVHSTLFLATAWFVLVWLPARLKTGDILRPAQIEAGWKLAAILPMITAVVCLSVDLSPSFLRWSYTLAESRSKDAIGTDLVIDPPTIARVPPVGIIPDSTPVAPPEQSLEATTVPEFVLSPLSGEPLVSDSSVARWELDVGKELEHVASGQILSSDRPEPSTSRPMDPIGEQPRPFPLVAGLGVVIVAWIGLCLIRLLRQWMKLASLLGRCLPFEVPEHDHAQIAGWPGLEGFAETPGLPALRSSSPGHPTLTFRSDKASGHRERNRLVPNGSRIRLLRLMDTATSPSHGTISGGVPIPNHQRHCSQPFACGIFHWTIVVPHGIEARLTPDELRALLAHEVAHLVRRDPVWQWIGEIFCTCLAFQPLNFLARRRWQWAAELLCDDWAVDRHIPPTLLATCLTKVAEWRLKQLAGSRWQSGLGVPAMGSDGSLTGRIHWLLRSKRNAPVSRPLVGRTIRTAAVTTGLLLGAYGPRFVFEASAQAARMEDLGRIVEPTRDVLEREVQQTLEELQRLQSQLERLHDLEVSAVAEGIFQRFSKLASQSVPTE